MNVAIEADRIDRAIASFGAAPRIVLNEVIERLVAAGTDIPPDDRLVMVRMRFSGEPFLEGIAGVIQRANAARLLRGEGPIPAKDVVALIRRERPNASNKEIAWVIGAFSDHLHREGDRLHAEADLLDAEHQRRAANDPGSVGEVS